MNRPFTTALAFIGFTVLLSSHYSSPTIVRANPSQQCASCGDPATANEQILFGSYYNIRDFSASLILNNKGPNPLLVRPTVFSLKGEPLDLAPIELPGVSAQTLDLATALASSGSQFREGSLELRYVYEGCRQVLSAGIILEDAGDRISYDELMARPAEFASNRLAGIWWVPSARSNMDLVLASRSGDPLVATIGVRSLGASSNTRNLEVRLRPRETQVVDVPKAFTIQGNGTQQWAAGSITIRHSGKPGELVARGMIEDRVMHYSSVIEFADPAAGKGSEWHAGGLRLGSVAGQALFPMVVVYNAGESNSTVNLQIPYSGEDGSTRSVALDPMVLAPGEVRELSAEVQAQTAGLDFDRIISSGVEVRYSTAPGTVLAMAQSVSRDGDHVFRAPMVDPQTKGSAGNYPWKVDNTTSTYVYLKNVTGQKQKYTVQVDFKGGSYVLGLQQLAPHATFRLDLRGLRDSLKPDQHKTVIPPDAEGGQVHWSVIGPDNHAMTGRAEYVSQAHGIASTFACSNCCPDSYYSGTINPFSATFPYDASTQYSAYQQNQNCYGGILFQFAVNTDSWTSNDPSIATINSSGMASGVGPGSTAVVTCWTVYMWRFAGPDMGCVVSSARICRNAGATVICPRPIGLQVSGPHDLGDGTLQISYTWQSSTGNWQDLKGRVQFREYIDYRGDFPPTSPPWPATFVNWPNPRIGDPIVINDYWFYDTYSMTTPVKPYSVKSIIGAQKYQFRCPCYKNNEWTTIEGPNDFVRGISQNQNGTWKYTFSKYTYSAAWNPLP